MTKKNLFMGETEDKRSFLEKLIVAYAPIDELVIRSARENGDANAAGEETDEPDTSHRKHGLGVKFAVRHLGSV